MALSASQIVVGGTGSVKVAPVGTTAPTDIATAWSVTWVDLGYTTEDGVTLRDEKTTTELKGWQAFYALRFLITGRAYRTSFTLMQWNKDTVPLAFGGGTITTTAGPRAHYRYDPPAPGFVDERALGIEWTDGSTVTRLIIPRGIVIDAVESQVTKSNSANLPIAFGALGTDGSVPWYLRTNNAAFA